MSMENTVKIDLSKCVVGIELGSTRIKAVLTDFAGIVLASGVSEWENRFVGGIWTYDIEDIKVGLQTCYADLKRNVKDRYGIVLTTVGGMGISAMMHGYIVTDGDGNLLVPFRTWRNNTAAKAAEILTSAFGFNIPARWSVAHIYEAVRTREPHINDIRFQTTLGGYVHFLLTDEKVIGIGEASGMFPIDAAIKTYDKSKLDVFDALTAEYDLPWKLADIMPEVLMAGQRAGVLTERGARFLDPDGDLCSGIPFCPPEGDAGTGMVATNSVRPRTGNVSAGTSIFSMVVLERPLSSVYPEIDMVSTPCGDPVAMVHCNNCTSDLNAWMDVFDELTRACGGKTDRNGLFRILFDKSLEAEPDCGGMLAYNYVSGENITDVTEGRPMLIRTTESRFDLANLMRAHLYSMFATLKIGLDIIKKEDVSVDSVVGHGGLFKTDGAPQKYLAATVGAPVTVMKTAGEGGAWGMALLAAYMLNGCGKSLGDWLDGTFSEHDGVTVFPDLETVNGLKEFVSRYKKALPVVRSAVCALSDNTKPTESDRIRSLKRRVFEANLELVENGLVIYTWGNVSEIDRTLGLVAIKPSGVDYDGMTEDDMVVVDLNGNVVEGKYRPSSDTPTHLELYKAHPEIGGVVHTHSVYATAFAQSGRPITAYGTTHADYFYGDVPCTRALAEAEIEKDYERNTGVVINELLCGKDALAVPAVLVKSHGPFAWGKNGANAVYNATVLEQVAKMATLTETLNPDAHRADGYLLDKHYNRKHGKNAYYGQKGE